MCVPVVSAALEYRAGWAAVSLLCSSSQKLSVQIPSDCLLLLLESVYIEILIDLIHSLITKYCLGSCKHFCHFK